MRKQPRELLPTGDPGVPETFFIFPLLLDEYYTSDAFPFHLPPSSLGGTITT
jgi:hypothetical protein